MPKSHAFVVLAVCAAPFLMACEESLSGGDSGSRPQPVADPTPQPGAITTPSAPAQTAPATTTPTSPTPSAPLPNDPMSNPGTAGTAGAPATPPAAPADTCGADPNDPGDGICPGGLRCGDPTGTQNYACMCPASPTSLPPCTVGGSECAAFPGTNCSNLFGMQGCHMGCTPPGAAPATCPDPLQCADPLMTGVAFCVLAGQITPPPCATQEDCAAYEGTFCMDPLALGILGCVKSCTL